MSIKIVKTHTADTHEAAMKIAHDLRTRCIPCSDPQAFQLPIGQLHTTKYNIQQYVRTEYPEI